QRAMPEYFTMKESCAPVVEGGVVYCGFADGVLAALQMDTGEMLWESDLSGSRTEFIDVDGRPIVTGSRVFAPSFDGGLYAVDKASGDKIWQLDLTGITDLAYGGAWIYAATANGRIVAIDSEN